MVGMDIFCGAGGMSLGAKNAGIDVICSIDNDVHALETYVFNFLDSNVIDCDVSKFDPASLNFKPDIIFGGPPCQGFSTSNQRTRNKENPANWLFNAFIRIATYIAPEWIVIENVKGLLETEEQFFYNAIVRKLKKNGYTVSSAVLNAVDYGVPQNRSRLFIVANRKGKRISFIKPNIGTPITVRDAIYDLPFLRNGAHKCIKSYKSNASSRYSESMRGDQRLCSNNLVTKNSPIVVERYKCIKQGENWTSIPEQLMNSYSNKERCHTGIYRRLSYDLPSVVIGNFRKNMLVHPTQNRGLSVREAARIQSFPDYFVFKGSIGFQQQQVGNAVPPILAKYVFEEIIDR